MTVKIIVHIRPYRATDAAEVGRLIADVYGQYNLSFVPPDERAPYLGPFHYARSQNPAHMAEVARMIEAQTLLVAANSNEEIVGVLRGSKERLHSLFVCGNYHRQGIGRLLLERFESENRALGAQVIRLASTLYAVPFYQSLGYKKSTGVRAGWSFDGPGFHWQPMKKEL